MKTEFVYFVHAVSCDKKTEEQLHKEHEIYNIKYDKESSFDEFMRLKKSWKEDKYSCTSFLSSVHDTLEEAQKYAEENICDINESGSYNYSVVSKVLLGCAYYNASQNKDEDFWIYQYDNSTKKYVKINKDNPVYNEILREVWGFISV